MGRYLGIQINQLRLVELIGKGGMGEVYRARHEVLEREFAVKILKKEIRSDPDAERRFEREARAASRLAHPNIVYISDFGKLSSGELYIVMEFLDGKSLRQILKERGPLPVDKVCLYLAQVAEGLHFAHRMGVIHRDLKSENIIVVRQGDREVVKIVDFGLAKLVEEGKGSLTGQGEIFGTPESMAPEQIASDPITHKVDIYALGILGYELLVGRPPFTGNVVKVLLAHKRERPQPPSMHRNDIPKPLEWMILKALEKRPEDRFDTAGEMAEICWKIYEYHTQEPRRVSSFSMPAFSSGEGPTQAAPDAEPFQPSRDPAEEVAARAYSILSGQHNIIHSGEERKSLTKTDERSSPLDEKEYLNSEWRSLLKQLSSLLLDRRIGDDRMRNLVAAIGEKEEELELVTGTYRNLLSEYHEYEKGVRERESRMMHALISLIATQKMHSLAGEDEHSSVIHDLEFQIAQLRRNLYNLDEERLHKEEEYDSRVLEVSLRLDTIEDELEETFVELDKVIEYVRNQSAASPVVRELYSRLDDLRNALEER